MLFSHCYSTLCVNGRVDLILVASSGDCALLVNDSLAASGSISQLANEAGAASNDDAIPHLPVQLERSLGLLTDRRSGRLASGYTVLIGLVV